MQAGKNWIVPKEINANSHWLEIWKNHLRPSMGPNRGSVWLRTKQIFKSLLAVFLEW